MRNVKNFYTVHKMQQLVVTLLCRLLIWTQARRSEKLRNCITILINTVFFYFIIIMILVLVYSSSPG